MTGINDGKDEPAYTPRVEWNCIDSAIHYQGVEDDDDSERFVEEGK